MTYSAELHEKSIPEMFINRVKRFGTAPVILYKKHKTYVACSWQELERYVAACAHHLHEKGIRAEDKVALLAESSLEWIIADLAILSLGAISVPLFPTYPRREVEYIITHAEARCIIVSDQKQFDKIARLCEKHQNQYLVYSFEHLDHTQCIHFSSACAANSHTDDTIRRNEFYRRIQRIREDQIASIIYTSGTTGPPKGVMLTHGNFLSNCNACAHAMPSVKGHIALSILPLSHVFERLAGYYRYLYVGIVLSFAESLTTLMKDMQLIRPHIANFVPRMFEKFYHKVLLTIESSHPFKKALFEWALGIGKLRYVYHLKKEAVPWYLACAYWISQHVILPSIRKSFGGRVQYFISGGAKLSRDIARFFYAAGILILEGYGLTETSPVVAVNRPDSNRFGTVGLPLEGIEVKILDDGEIAVKGPNVMKGYYKDEEATRLILINGWLHTGDIGSIDECGMLRITDRKKDIFVTSGGKNIAPQNIENLLKSDPYINQAVVCGDGEKYLSVLIVPDRSQVELYAKNHHIAADSYQKLLTEEAILTIFKKHIESSNKELAEHERLKKFTLLADEFTQEKGELTATFKVKRSVVLAHYKDEIAAMYRKQDSQGD